MGIIIILIGVSMLLAGGFLIGFIVSLSRGQFDDMFTPSVRILFDETTETTENNEHTK